MKAEKIDTEVVLAVTRGGDPETERPRAILTLTGDGLLVETDSGSAHIDTEDMAAFTVALAEAVKIRAGDIARIKAALIDGGTVQ